jgi:hypothetical protein
MQNEQLTKILLSIQRALWGMIYPEIRAIAVGIPKANKLKVIVYLDRQPIENDYENIKVVTSEVLADVPELNEFEEECVFSDENISTLDSLDSWVYVRQEN